MDTSGGLVFTMIGGDCLPGVVVVVGRVVVARGTVVVSPVVVVPSGYGSAIGAATGLMGDKISLGGPFGNLGALAARAPASSGRVELNGLEFSVFAKGVYSGPKNVQKTLTMRTPDSTKRRARRKLWPYSFRP